HEFGNVFWFRAGENLVPPRLVVQGAPVPLTNVRLVADDLMMLRNPLRPELDPAVRLVLVAEQLELQLQLEVAVARGRAQELVPRDDGVERTANDRAVLAAQGLFVPLPGGAILAVEEGFRLGRDQNAGDQDNCETDGTHGESSIQTAIGRMAV